MDRGFDVTGRETRGEFKDLSFTDQVETVKEDLLNHFWTEDSRVIANSFGAYLFLHAQASLDPIRERCCCCRQSLVALQTMRQVGFSHRLRSTSF